MLKTNQADHSSCVVNVTVLPMCVICFPLVVGWLSRNTNSFFRWMAITNCSAQHLQKRKTPASAYVLAGVIIHNYYFDFASTKNTSN